LIRHGIERIFIEHGVALQQPYGITRFVKAGRQLKRNPTAGADHQLCGQRELLIGKII
jgi:hypothetical protein